MRSYLPLCRGRFIVLEWHDWVVRTLMGERVCYKKNEKAGRDYGMCEISSGVARRIRKK